MAERYPYDVGGDVDDPLIASPPPEPSIADRFLSLFLPSRQPPPSRPSRTIRSTAPPPLQEQPPPQRQVRFAAAVEEEGARRLAEMARQRASAPLSRSRNVAPSPFIDEDEIDEELLERQRQERQQRLAEEQAARRAQEDERRRQAAAAEQRRQEEFLRTLPAARVAGQRPRQSAAFFAADPKPTAPVADPFAFRPAVAANPFAFRPAAADPFAFRPAAAADPFAFRPAVAAADNPFTVPPQVRRQPYEGLRRRLALADALAAGTARIPDQCDVSSLMVPSTAQVLAPSRQRSASETVFLLGKLAYEPRIADAKDDVVCKISFEPLPDRRTGDNSLLVEIDVYRTVVNDILRRRLSPHVVVYYGSWECRQFARRLEEQLAYYRYGVANSTASRLLAATRAVANVEYDVQRAHVLLLERGIGVPLVEWATTARTADDWRAMLWQVLYTVEVFNRIGLRHNDLHLGNVWMQQTGSGDPPMTAYVLGVNASTARDLYAVPRASHSALIYDFDFAYLSSRPGVARNNRIDQDTCRRVGVCNRDNAKFDAIVFLTLVYRHPSTPRDVRRTILSWIDESYLIRRWAFVGRPCRLTYTGDCDGELTNISDRAVLPVLAMLRSDYFAPYRQLAANATSPLTDVYHLPPA